MRGWYARPLWIMGHIAAARPRPASMKLLQSSAPRRLFASLKPARKPLERQAAAPEDLFEGIKDKVESKTGIRAWLAELKQKLDAQPGGPFFLGGSVPFPHNPSFVPHTPITDALRNKLYELHRGDPEHWSPRQLSAKYKVAIPRVRAIIKMKTMEAALVQEGRLVVDGEYVKKMEAVLGSKAPVKTEPEPADVNSIAAHLRPVFVAMPETAPALTPRVRPALPRRLTGFRRPRGSSTGPFRRQALPRPPVS